jgi:hypothetical protein
MVLRYRDIVEEEVYWYTRDEGVAEVLGHRSQTAYDQIEDAIKDQLYNEDMYGYLLDIAKKEKDKQKAKEKVDEELRKMILEVERELSRESIL